jgi:hypothetical protein
MTTLNSFFTTAAKTFAAFFIPFIIMTLAIAAIHGPVSGAGIIALDGYPHAVVICGEAVTINDGHANDPEISQLLALAAEICAAYE